MLWLDLETYSEQDLGQVGAYRYAEDASTEVLLFGYAVGDGPCQVWEPAIEPQPADLADALADRDLPVVAHNSNFDRTVLRLVWDWDLPIERWLDSMVKAYAHGLPGKLDSLGEVFGLDEDVAKIKDGNRLIHKFCKPAGAKERVARHTRYADPEDWERFREYGWRDVEAMREIWHRIPNWNYPRNVTELAAWHLDQRINDRGIAVDLPMARAAINATEREQRRLADRTEAITEGQVESATQRDRLLAHIREAYGVELENAQKATLESALGDDGLPAPVKDLIRIRLQAGRSSSSKFAAMERRASSDSRLRGMLQFHGAIRTGRWASRGINLQNLPRPEFSQRMIEAGIQAMHAEGEHLVFDDVMSLAASSVRAALCAPEGRQLTVSDLSNIEGRMLAWVAGEKDKIAKFRAFDRGEGHDIYKVTAGQILGKDPAAINKEERLVLGKVPELALGYQGGVGAFQSMAAVYGTDMADHWPTLQQTLPAEALQKARENWTKWGKAKVKEVEGIPKGDEPDQATEDRWLAAEAVKISWRDRHPAIRSFWYELEDAAKAAVKNPGAVYHCRRLVLNRTGQWLRIKLPSGRLLVYPQPKIKLARADMGEEMACQSCGGSGTSPVNEANDCPDCEGRGVARYKEQLSFMGVDQQTRKWVRIKTYGGSLCIAEGTPVLTEHGWRPIETVSSGTRVWDGEEWAQQDGAVFQGAKPTNEAFGVHMTPDHEVLTTEGWRRASQIEGLDRASCRLPDGFGVCGQQRKEITLAGSVRLRAGEDAAGHGIAQDGKKRGSVLMRLYAGKSNFRVPDQAWHVAASGLRRLALYAGALLSAQPLRLPQLRRAWDRGLRALVRIRGFLGGHGPLVPAGADAGARGQRGGILAGKLPLGQLQRAGEQHAQHPVREHARRPDDRSGCGQVVGYRGHYPALPSGQRLPRGSAIQCAESRECVYDLLNCGPRRRFVVKDRWGQPLIVHNCENVTQAASRDVLRDGMLRAEAAGWTTVLTVHDEVVCDEPADGNWPEADLSAYLATVPDWAEGLPLAAEGYDHAKRYRKD